MTSRLAGTAALVTGASSGIGAATARRLAEEGASVALVARRRDRLEALAAEIDQAGGITLVVEADITGRNQAEAAAQQAVDRFGRLDILVNNAGLMLLGPVVGADAQERDRMIAINVQGLLYTTRAALPHLLQAAEDGPRRGARTTRKHRPSSVATGCAPLGHVCRWQQIAPDRDTWSRSWAGIQLPMELEQWDGGGEGGRQRAIGLADKEHTT